MVCLQIDKSVNSHLRYQSTFRHPVIQTSSLKRVYLGPIISAITERRADWELAEKNQNHRWLKFCFQEKEECFCRGDSFPAGVVNASDHLRASSQTAQKQPPEKQRRSKVKLPQNKGRSGFRMASISCIANSVNIISVWASDSAFVSENKIFGTDRKTVIHTGYNEKTQKS